MSDQSTGGTVQTTLGGEVKTRLVNVSEVGRAGVTMIDRSTDFGNRFKMEKVGGEFTREGCVEAFEEWWHEDEQAPLRARAVRELVGETLGCYCLGEGDKYDSNEPISEVKDEPSVCHGEVILQFLNQVDSSVDDDQGDQRE